MNLNLGQNTIAQLLGALPEQFDFYHLGNVELSPESGPSGSAEVTDLSRLLDEHHAIGFSFRGELKALLVVCFDKSLDVSTYSELGNILASRLAMRLSDEAGIEVLISPPQALSESHLGMLPKLGSLIAERTYRHFDRGQVVAIRTFLLANPSSSEERGNA